MKYVIDCSVAFKWVVPEVLSDKAQLLRDDFRNAVHELLAPDLFPTEVANALLIAERRARISPASALLFDDVLTTLPVLHASLGFVRRARDIAAAYQATVYDCLYVALGEQEKCEVVTADDKLVNKLQSAFPFVKHLSTLP